jgi:hypothetical protein
MSDYEILGVPYDADQRTIKRAYAALIKQYRPDSHPTEFARIRVAYEKLLEQCRYREQYESNTPTLVIKDSEPQADEPVLQQADNEEIDSFSRLIDKPVILPIQNETEHGDPYSQLVDKPIIQLPDEVLSDESIWINSSIIDVRALIAQLDNYQQPDNEQAALACFQAQLEIVATMNLEQRMDYEEKLYSCLIYDDTPPLLVFAAANAYFNWTNTASWIKAAQSKWSRQRFDGLCQLSVLYPRVCKRYNPYFQAKYSVKPYWLTSDYRQQQAQQQREEWLRICQAAHLRDLENYFTDTAKTRVIYFVDFLFGAFLSYSALIISFSLDLFNNNQPLAFLLMPIIVLAGSLLCVFLLLVWRMLNFKISRGTKWTAICIAIIFSAKLPEKLGQLLVSALLAGVALNFVYSCARRLETLVSKVADKIIELFSRYRKRQPMR